jgi:hypothetical protein
VSVRAAILAVVVVAVVGVAGLLLAAGSEERSTAFSLDIPPAGSVATLHTGEAACQGPLTVTAAFGFVTPWVSPAERSGLIAPGPAPGAAIDLTVRDAVTNQSLATGQIGGSYAAAIAPAVALTRTIPSGRRVRVCLRSRGPGTVDLLGAPLPNQALADDDGSATGTPRAAIALLFKRQNPRSLLSLVPTMFARASLFRPGWVGPWTYWVLSAAFLGAFALGGVALARAMHAEAASDTHDHDPIT